MKDTTKIITVDIKKIKPSPGKLPSCFREAVGMLKRPYYPISKKNYTKIMDILAENRCDFFIFRGKIATVGTADGGYSIMPLTDERQ